MLQHAWQSVYCLVKAVAKTKSCEGRKGELCKIIVEGFGEKDAREIKVGKVAKVLNSF